MKLVIAMSGKCAPSPKAGPHGRVDALASALVDILSVAGHDVPESRCSVTADAYEVEFVVDTENRGDVERLARDFRSALIVVGHRVDHDHITERAPS